MRRDTSKSNDDMALGEREARLRSILDAANVIAWEVDLVGNSVHSTGPVRRMLDRPESPVPTDVAGMAETIHPEDRDSVMARFWSVLSTDATFRFEFRLNSDVLRWVTAEGSIVRDADGWPVQVRGITHDITERKKAELALAERNVQLALAGKAALVGSYAYDTDTEVMQISEGYAAIHGFPEGTTEKRRNECLAGVHPDDIARVEQFRREAFRACRREYSVEYRIVRDDGELRWVWVETRCFIAYDDERGPRRVVGVSIDITERKRVEEQQRILVAELDHRVKNVLATVQAVAAQTMETSCSMEHFVAALDGRIRSMGSTHELLSHRRWLGIPLAELVERQLAPYTTGSNVEVDGPDVMLSAEASQTMAMALHELATNAAKYGALSTLRGQVSVRWGLGSNGHGRATLKLDWHEKDGPVVTVPAKAGFGTSVIRDLIPYELGGGIDHVLAPSGVRCQMEIPLAHLSGPSSQNKGSAQRSHPSTPTTLGGRVRVEAQHAPAVTAKQDGAGSTVHPERCWM